MNRLLVVLLLLVMGCQPAAQQQPPTEPSKPVQDEFNTPPEVTAPPVPRIPTTQYTPNSQQAPPQQGNFGYTPPSAEERAKERESLGIDPLSQEAPQLFEKEKTLRDPDGASAEEPVLLYRYLYAAWPEWKSGSQGIGDCVSWGWAHAGDVLRCKLWYDAKLPRGPPPLFAATESIYGGSRVESRGRKLGGYSDGSYGGAAAKWVRDWGVVYRTNYPTLNIDLTQYSAKRAKDWGNFGNGGQNDDGKLDLVAKEHPIKQVALVRSFKEAAVAIKNGYPVPVCSGQGFSSTRDEDGFSRPSGSWAHCMCFTGVRFDRPGLLCQNSWGTTWIKGPKWPNETKGPRGPPQPDGSFWVDEKTVDRMLAGQDSFATAGLGGFKSERLRNDEGW